MILTHESKNHARDQIRDTARWIKMTTTAT